MTPRASILGSRWRPRGPSETPRAYFGGLGGDVGAPGDLLEAPRRALWSSRGGLGIRRECSRVRFEDFGPFWVGLWSIFCAGGGSQHLYLFWSFSKLVFFTSSLPPPDFLKMAEIAPDWELPVNWQLFARVRAFDFLWSLGKTASENGRNTDEIPVDIR